MYRNFRMIKDIKRSISGVELRKIQVLRENIFILYIPQITDRRALSEDIIKPLILFDKDLHISAESISNSVIYSDDVVIDNDNNKIKDYIVKGKSVIVIENQRDYLVINTTKIERRGIDQPQIETALRAPKDAFIENLDANLSLIRYRIKDPSLIVEPFVIGDKTKTNVAIVYMEGLANENCINIIKNRLTSKKIKGVLDSGHVQKLLSNKDKFFFPEIGISERSDTACGNILDGKICVLVEGSDVALVAPQTFVEFLDAGEDHYDNPYTAILIKLIRYSAVTITLTFSAIYVTLVAFNPDILPPKYILVIASSRVAVPVNAVIEATLMELISEILREASIRLPKQIGPAIGIVGTIVIGQAAVSAGLVSPLMIIIIALSSMSSFAIPDYTIINAIRLFKFFLIFLTGIFGLYGFLMGITIFFIKLVSTNSVGVPYLAPIAPFNFKDVVSYFFSSLKEVNETPEYLNKVKKN